MSDTPIGGQRQMVEATPVVDTHLHVASPDRCRYPRNAERLPTSTWWESPRVDGGALAGCLADADVACGLVVQAVGLYGFDNRYLLDAVSAHRDRLRAVVAVDVAAPGYLEAIARAGQDPAVVGVRLFAIGTAGSWVGTPRAVAAVRACGEAGVVAVLTALGADLGALGPALATCPEVPVAVDHCAFPAIDAGRIAADDPVWSLLAMSNLSLKITSHLLADGAGTNPAVPVEQLAQRFGVRRLVWGSDHPQTALGPYGHHLHLARLATAGLRPDERAAVLGGNAVRLFDLAGRAGRAATG